MITDTFQKKLMKESEASGFSRGHMIIPKKAIHPNQKYVGVLDKRKVKRYMVKSRKTSKFCFDEGLDENDCGTVKDKHLKRLAKILKSIHKVHELEINCLNCWSDELTDIGLTFISERIMTFSCLRSLKLDFCGVEYQLNDGITNEGLSHLGRALKSLRSLRELNLNLGHRMLGNEEMRSICKGLKRLISLQSITLSFYR